MDHSGHQSKFNDWRKTWRIARSESMMLTNIAFGLNSSVRPVFLLNEIQNLCKPTKIESTFPMHGESQMHTRLSLLLNQLAQQLWPLCICTGTNNGEILSITEKSAVFPKLLWLTLMDRWWVFWNTMTTYSNGLYPQERVDVDLENDEKLIEALAFASYRAPRLLFIAHTTWFQFRRLQKPRNRLYYTQQFEEKASEYYPELLGALKVFSAVDLAHLVLSCGVHWPVRDTNLFVPGTGIKWSKLIQSSVVFPYYDDCHIFPFILIWKVNSDCEARIAQIENCCKKMVANTTVGDLYLLYDID